jgi:putative tryptophan/tyrosine transport system ATP-binding protein
MIQIRDLQKRFNVGTVNEVHALQNISLQVKESQFVTIIGTNGSGKSTLLNAIAGSFLPDEGTIQISGEDKTRKRDFERATHISRVFQNPYMGTAPLMTIAENLHMAYMRSHKSLPVMGLNRRLRAHFREEVRQLEMQLEDRLDTVIGTLSGGQRQAVTLLMAVINKPRVLLLDEHTAALDPKSAAQVIRLTQKFIDQGKLTAVMVTHSMQQALDLGDRTIMMHKGRIIDDISRHDRQHMTVDDLLEKFAELRKIEHLTEDVMSGLKREYA